MPLQTQRTLHLANPLVKGTDVTKCQTLLKKHQWFGGAVDGVFGPATAKACAHAKYQLGYASADIKPTCGALLISYLDGTAKVPKEYVQRAALRSKIITHPVEEGLRAKIVANAKWGVAHNAQIHYEEIRPIDGINHPYELPLHTDCSGFVTLCYKWADAPDPNGFNYNGEGYTGSLLQHLRHITLAEVKVGDPVIYGAYPGHHVCLVVETGDDPLLASNGGEDGPDLVRHSVEARYQPNVVSWMTLPKWSN